LRMYFVQLRIAFTECGLLFESACPMKRAPIA